jgi:hypothetical protein
MSGWFDRHGFGDLAFSPDQIAICGIKQVASAATKNAATHTTGWQPEPVRAW